MNLKFAIYSLCIIAFPLFAAEESPQAALTRLLEGNERFSQDKSTCPDRNQERRAATVAKQNPFAIILGCSDSRVPPELVFDQGVGDLFIIRIAGNVIGPTELESILYSVTTHNTKVILVLGHEGCGAIKAVLDHSASGIETIAQLIEPSVAEAHKEGGNAWEKTIKLNALQMAENLKKVPVISKQIAEKKLLVVAGYYELNSGRVQILK